MNTMKKNLQLILIMMICVVGTGVCSASDNNNLPQEKVLLVVVDKSKEAYGIQLKNQVYDQLEKQLKFSIVPKNKLQEIDKDNDLEKITEAEKPELSDLAAKNSVNRLLVVEILPTKSDFSEILFYQAIKSEATIKVRLYDAVEKQYILTAEIGSTDTNTTIIPYTFVGRKVTVLEAVHKAVDIVVQKINQRVGE